MANDSNCAYYTSSAFTGTTCNILTASNVFVPGVNEITMGNLPYNQGNMTNSQASGGLSCTGRIVSAGARITYTGTTMNESGTYAIFADPTHQNVIITATAPSAIGSVANGDVCGTTRNPCTLSLFPVSPLETQYSSEIMTSQTLPLTHPFCNNEDQMATGGAFVRAVGGFNQGCPVAVMFVSGVAGSTYLVEYIQHIEYAGLNTAASVTPTESDQAGFEMVTAAAQRIPQIKMSSSPTRSMASMMVEGLKSAANALKPIAVDALTSGLAAMLL